MNIGILSIFLILFCESSYGQSVEGIKAKHISLKNRLIFENQRKERHLSAAKKFRNIRDRRQLKLKQIRDSYVRPKPDDKRAKLKDEYLKKIEVKEQKKLKKQQAYAKKEAKRRAVIEELIQPLKKKAYGLDWDENDESSL